MPKYLNILFRQRGGQAGDGHTGPEDLACLAQGCLEEEKRGPIMEHVLNCDRCYRVVEETLVELERDRAASRPRSRIFKGPGLAVAASILTAMVGVGVYYNLDHHKPDDGPLPVARQMMRSQEPKGEMEEKIAAAPAPRVLEERKPVQENLAEEQVDEQEVTQAPAPGKAATRRPPFLGAAGEETPGGAPAGKSAALGLAKVRPRVQAPEVPPARATLHLRIDSGLLALLRESRDQTWTDPEAIRYLGEIIRKKTGHQVNLDRVSWAGAYPERLGAGAAPESLIINLKGGEALLSLGEE